MKFFLAVFVFNLVLAINAKEIDTTVEEKCLKEVGIDLEVYKTTLEKKIEDADMPIKCLSKCMMKEKKMINEDGAFDVEKIAALIFTEPENIEAAKPFIESCLKVEKKERKRDTEEAEKKEEEEAKEAEEDEETVEEVKKEPSCEEAYDMIICVTKNIEKALEEN